MQNTLTQFAQIVDDEYLMSSIDVNKLTTSSKIRAIVQQLIKHCLKVENLHEIIQNRLNALYDISNSAFMLNNLLTASIINVSRMEVKGEPEYFNIAFLVISIADLPMPITPMLIEKEGTAGEV